MKILNRLQLKSKLLLLGVLPAAILAIILAAYFTTTRLNDMYDLLHKTNQNLANSIAESSVNGVYSGNLEELHTILGAVVNEPDIISVKITNPVGTTLAELKSNITFSEVSKKITQAIQLKTIHHLDEFDSFLVGRPNDVEKIIGYVSLALSYKSMKQRERVILLNSILITVPLLLIIGFIAKYMSMAIGKPILQLTTEVEDISHGSYTPPSNDNDNDEISILSTGIHNMARQINSHQNELEKKYGSPLKNSNCKMISSLKLKMK